ncbi:hypothetical protein IJT93_08070 [bacterium]|nr:hypothetical protein [bacterium]
MAVRGVEIIYGSGRTFDYFSEEENKFIEKVGWGNCNERDAENPNVFIRCYKNGMRECRPSEEKKGTFSAAMLGSSFTLGMGVKAEDTMIYLLNERYPQAAFDNWGVNGWGPAQMYARLENLFSDKKFRYNLVVYNFISGNITRNVSPEAYGDLRLNGRYVAVPYGKFNLFGKYNIVYADEQRWPLQDKLLTVNFLRRSFFSYKTLEYQNKIAGYPFIDGAEKQKLLRLNIEIINRMQRFCKENGSDFLVCALSADISPVGLDRELFRQIDAEVVNVDMPYGQAYKPENRVLHTPGFHPNENVHRYWAQEFSKWFDKRYAEYLDNN